MRRIRGDAKRRGTSIRSTNDDERHFIIVRPDHTGFGLSRADQSRTICTESHCSFTRRRIFALVVSIVVDGTKSCGRRMEKAYMMYRSLVGDVKNHVDEEEQNVLMSAAAASASTILSTGRSNLAVGDALVQFIVRQSFSKI